MLLPDDMKQVMLDAFQEYGCPFSYEIVTTVAEARKILTQNLVHAIVMTRSLALLGDDGTNGLMTLPSGLPPTITLIQPGDGYPDYLYSQHKNNDWVTMPFDLQELYIHVSNIIHRANK
jgi:DNA-binding response OmpR family regulator